jgi:YggT family protein|tara:strand:- start:415 stop:663 length:249 start_codon:yes stop_codon:yes gene_type:complete
VDGIIQLVGVFIQFLGFAIFARAILSWFPIDQNGTIPQALNSITSPILDPLRKVIPPLGTIDLTPMIAMFLLLVIGGALTGG